MNSSNEMRRLKRFLNKDRSWLEDRINKDDKDLIFRSLWIKELKEEMDNYFPFVYGNSNIKIENPEIYDSFDLLRKNLNKHGAEVERTIGSYIDNLENKKNNHSDVLENLMTSCENLEDVGNYHRAKRLHEKENDLKKDAVEIADKDYFSLKKRFMSNNWKIKNISELELMLEHSDLLVDKGRFLGDEELIYHSAELSSEIASLLNTMKSRKERTRKAKIGFVAGFSLGLLALIQPYTPIQPVKKAISNTYQEISDFFSRESNKNTEINPISDESIQQSYKEETRIGPTQ